MSIKVTEVKRSETVYIKDLDYLDAFKYLDDVWVVVHQADTGPFIKHALCLSNNNCYVCIQRLNEHTQVVPIKELEITAYV